jgi:uncharacterized glyoxalase superfamily protein PhnB
MLVNRSAPPTTVIPQLAYPDVIAAAKWLCAAFGFSVRLGIGTHRVQLNVGDGAVVVMELPPEKSLDGSHQNFTCSVMIRVDDVNAHHDHALQHGVRILRPPADYPYGERQYTVADLVGRPWTFTQSIADVDPIEWGGAPGRL